ncbi:MAG: hypothetical protein QG669_367, partial [Patescibacteria group bacterium]|nr:hypothetical protein [Patescibacteria group bacterium]
ENDIRLRFIREIKTVKNLIPEVVACMKSGFATESENSKKMMSDALCPILQPANIVLYNDTQDFGRKLSSIFKGEFNFKELEGALV